MTHQHENSSKPRVLFFTPYGLANASRGGPRRTSLFHTCLERHAQLFTVYHERNAALPSGPDAVSVRVRWAVDRIFDRRLRRAVLEAVESFKPDLLWAEMFYTIPLLAQCARQARIPLVFNSHNVEYERFAAWSPLHRVLVRRYEARCLRDADWTICVSARDQDLFQTLYGADSGRLRVLPNGFDDRVWMPGRAAAAERAAMLVPLGIAPDAPLALFFGNHHYKPNAEALERIETTVAPGLAQALPDARILVLGPGSEGRTAASPNVVYGGTAPELLPYLHAADLLICPLRHGGGSRLKIIESLASGLAALSTPKGAEGLETLGEESGLFRAEWDTFVPKAVALLKAPPARPAEHSENLCAYGLPAICRATAAVLDEIIAAR